ncbi:MAG: type 4a pilus biogenesis protein PilO [Wenzhouxiangella sp.]|nr:type 4a pilus biogenesis protein PilO [Wenzhouxiangella sp.]TVR97652.1 MAG: fimbrial protein [Wenzhouxiangellaceae bacterium]
MDLNELKDLDFNNLGSASAGAKAVIIGFVVILILAGGYFLMIKDKRASLEQSENVEVRLKAEFRQKQQKAANLERYEAQLEEMEDMLASMLQQLPSRTEMPALLIDISRTAQGSGIRNELFEPRSEVLRDFYAEQPISVRLVGTYHEFGTFVSSVASLSRVVILTMRDISLQPIEGGNLRMEGTVTTYRYLDPAEMDAGMGHGR